MRSISWEPPAKNAETAACSAAAANARPAADCASARLIFEEPVVGGAASGVDFFEGSIVPPFLTSRLQSEFQWPASAVPGAPHLPQCLHLPLGTVHAGRGPRASAPGVEGFGFASPRRFLLGSRFWRAARARAVLAARSESSSMSVIWSVMSSETASSHFLSDHELVSLLSWRASRLTSNLHERISPSESLVAVM